MGVVSELTVDMVSVEVKNSQALSPLLSWNIKDGMIRETFEHTVVAESILLPSCIKTSVIAVVT